MDAKGKLIEVLRKHRGNGYCVYDGYHREVADAILDEFDLTPKVPTPESIVEEEAKRMANIIHPQITWPSITWPNHYSAAEQSGYRALARDSFERQARAECEGIRARCYLNELTGCPGFGCSKRWRDSPCCGTLQRAAWTKRGMEPKE